MSKQLWAAYVAALLLTMSAGAQAAGAHMAHGMPMHQPLRLHSVPVTHVMETRPWVEGVNPSLENRLFDATYRTLPSHNVLKVYVFNTNDFQSAGIRFSARVPHELRDLTRSELNHEAADLIRTVFDQFPDIQTLDVWATIPVPKTEMTQVESTVFSVSADRDTYLAMRDDAKDDADFLNAFGHVWVAPEVPQ